MCAGCVQDEKQDVCRVAGVCRVGCVQGSRGSGCVQGVCRIAVVGEAGVCRVCAGCVQG